MTSREAIGLLSLSAIAVVVGRLAVPGHDLSAAGSYEAAAHLWCGYVAAVAYYRWRTATGWIALALLASLTAFETAMFLAR